MVDGTAQYFCKIVYFSKRLLSHQHSDVFFFSVIEPKSSEIILYYLRNGFD